VTVGDDWNECRAIRLHFQSSRLHYGFCTTYLEPALKTVNAAIVPFQGSIFQLEAGLQAALESVLPMVLAHFRPRFFVGHLYRVITHDSFFGSWVSGSTR
jgi:hypothetical protein